ncbi:glycosyltransferase family 2 protein [Candidatus Uhrbacteria bacterium]|nr:glycosyltransferase family 2 protein [Candidatus Uhrbacteria bacterium]
MQPKVAIVYLSYNGKKYLDEVLSALRVLNYPRESLEFVFVDNASSDGSQDYLRGVNDITFFPNKKNLGFAEGNNIGINHALLHGADYVFLHNNDLKLHPDAIKESVALAESDPKIGSVQSLMKFWKHPEIVNSSGGMVHFLGFGFVRDNGKESQKVLESWSEGTEIAYSSGAAVLYRAEVLKKVGLLDPFLFLYHEDLELGWRIRLAGFKNVLSVRSLAFHDYEFKRSVKKFFWMERNRWLVHFSHLKFSTLILFLPLMFILEIPLLVFALFGGWWKQKLLVYVNFLSPRAWVYVLRKRKESNALRKVSDAEIVRLFTCKIEHQETNNPIVTKIGNPILCLVWAILKSIIRW